MKINKETFCVAPWFQIRNQTDQTKKVCGKINLLPSDKNTATLNAFEYLNSPELINLKTDLQNGLKQDCCRECWQDEEKGIVSLRQYLNSSLTNGNFYASNWVDLYFKHKKNYESDLLLSADIKIGNTCNHACIMCNPYDSTMIRDYWKVNKNNEFVNEYITNDKSIFDKTETSTFSNSIYRQYIDDVLNNTTLQSLKILGGEPLLDKRLLTKLRKLPQQQKDRINLQIVTNGSIDILKSLQYIGTFKHVEILVSLEGVDHVQEYARYGSKWSLVSKHILDASKSDQCNLTVHTTLQTTTILGFEDLINWCFKHDIHLTAGIVDEPKYLSLQSLLPSVKNKLLHRFKSKYRNSKNVKQKYLYNLITKIENIEFNEELYLQFLRYVEFYQKNKTVMPLIKIFPELYR